MWNHLKADRLFDIVQGTQLNSDEQRHFDRCEFCQEMLRFFRECVVLDGAIKSDVA